MLLNGEFTVRVEDSPMQVIPTNWVQQAVARWHEREHELKHLKQLVIGADVAQGGADSAVYAPLYETDMFGELKSYPGRDTPDGPAIVLQLLRHRKDKSLIVLDGTGGWAGDAYRTLQERHNIDAELCVASKGSQEWTEDMMFKMANVRSAMWWGFRNALNPESRYDIALPPDPRLEAQLTAPTWFVRGKELFVESKDDLRKRLGSSTDEADPVLMAWFYRDQAILDRARQRVELVDKYNNPDYDPRNPDAIHDKEFELDDPLKDW